MSWNAKLDQTFSDLEQTLSSLLEELTPVPADQPVRPSELLTFGTEEGDFEKWHSLVRERLAEARRFEIHCWHGEEDCLALAEPFGRRREDPWRHGVILEGEVTEAFAAMVLAQPRPKDQDIYRKLTPFFNLFLDDTFQSGHYGTEVYLIEPMP